MTVLDIANPSMPSVVAHYKPRPEFNAAAIDVASGYAYVGGVGFDVVEIISGNTGAGIGLRGPAAAQNFIIGNVIGKTASGSPLGNGGVGILVDSSEGNFIQRNTIANNNGAGVSLTDSAANRLRRNSITANAGQGVANDSDASLTAMPVIATATATTVTGTACAGCLVEVFSDASNEGRVYDSETAATPDGAFNLTKGGGFTGPNVTATASNPAGATSIFSRPVALNGTPPLTPAGLDATAISTSEVSVEWGSVAGASRYLVSRRSPGAPPQQIALVTTSSMSDSAVSPQTAYVYQVRALGPGGASALSTPALATTMTFTDDPMVAGHTVVRRNHLLEIRAALAAVCLTAGLPAPSWTDATIVAGVTFVRAVHMTELRDILVQALSALGVPLPTFTRTISTGGVVRAIHIQELRTAVR